MAYMLEGTALVDDGRSQPFSFKAWEPSGASFPGSELRWELRRLASAVGFKDDTHRRQLCNRVSANLDAWRLLWIDLGWQVKAVFGVPRKSLESLDRLHDNVEQQELAECEDNYWVTTKAMVSLLLLWLQNRRHKDDRTLTMAVLFTCFQRTLRVDACGKIHVREPTEEHVAMCAKGRHAGDECCACFRRCVEVQALQLDHLEHPPQVMAARSLCILFEMRECRCVLALLSECLQQLGQSIDEDADNWGDTDLLRAGGIVHRNTAGRATRSDPHMRDLLLRKAIQDGQAATSSSLLRTLHLGTDSVVHHWTEKGLADMIAAIRLSFAEPGNISVCGDEADIGKPKKKHLLMLQAEPRKQTNCVCTPQAAHL